MYYSKGSWKFFDAPLLAFCVRGRWWVSTESRGTCGQEPCTQPIAESRETCGLLLQQPVLLNSMTLEDILNEELNLASFVGVVIFDHSSLITLATSILHLASIVLYADCLIIEWCQLAWGTMGSRFVYLFIVNWTHSGWLTSTTMIQIYILLTRLMPFQNVIHNSMSYFE